MIFCFCDREESDRKGGKKARACRREGGRGGGEGGRKEGREGTYLRSDEAALEDRVFHRALNVVESKMKGTIYLDHDGEEG